MLEICEYSELGDPELIADWDALDATHCMGTLFTTRMWIGLWTEHFGSGLSVAAVLGHESGRAVGLAPLLTTAAHELVLPVNFLSPRGEFIVGEDDARGFVRAVLTNARTAGSPLRLQGVPVGSPTLAAIESEAGGAGYLVHAKPARVSPFIAIEGAWDGYFEGKPRKVTHEWERKMRRLEKAGDVRVLRFEGGMDARKLTDDFIAVEERSWKKRAGTSITARGVSGFYHRLSAALAAKGEFDPFWLEIDGRVVAFLYGAVQRGTYYAMKTSYDEESSRLSPGVRLFHEAVSSAFGAGLARFDFLGERAPWKDEWANGWLEHVNVRLYPDTVSGRAAHLFDSQVKPLARRARGAGKKSR